MTKNIFGRSIFGVLAVMSTGIADANQDIVLSPVQTTLFSDPGAQSNAWGDFNNDGFLDLAVVFRDAPARLYQNRPGVFVDVGAQLGLPTDGGNPRSVAWADIDNDGDLDLYIGYADQANRLLRNDIESGQPGFTDISETSGADTEGMTRQVSFVDYDADGDVDLFVAIRNGENRLLKNNNGMFVDVTSETGIGDPRRTVGACWFDMDMDGDLDLYTANQNGDSDGVFRNDSGVFKDVAAELNMDQPGRPKADGSVGCAIVDFNNDGNLDLYIAQYGEDSLFKNLGEGRFKNVAHEQGLANPEHIVTGVWADVQNDGLPDLFSVGYINGKPETADYLYVNNGDGFTNRLPDSLAANGADHGAQWADYDQDGDMDLVVATNDPAGSHYLFRNDLPESDAKRSIQVLVLNETGLYTRAGSEVRIYRHATNELMGTAIVDTGSGYNSQNAKPVHFGLSESTKIDVHVTVLTGTSRKTSTYPDVDWESLDGKPFEVRTTL